MQFVNISHPLPGSADSPRSVVCSPTQVCATESLYASKSMPAGEVPSSCVLPREGTRVRLVPSVGRANSLDEARQPARLTASRKNISSIEIQHLIVRATLHTQPPRKSTAEPGCCCTPNPLSSTRRFTHISATSVSFSDRRPRSRRDPHRPRPGVSVARFLRSPPA